MKARRPYKVNVRWHGDRRVIVERGRSYTTRERAFEAAISRLNDAVSEMRLLAERKGQMFDPTRWDATVFGPDSDLGTGRIVRHDGLEADLMETVHDDAQKSREALRKAGWTDEDIERGRKA